MNAMVFTVYLMADRAEKLLKAEIFFIIHSNTC